MKRKLNRRTFLRSTVAASAGGTLALSLEEKALFAQIQKRDIATKSTVLTQDGKDEGPKGRIPCGKIGNTSISRLILGGNLIGGAAHSRDLIYASQLIRNYFTDEKIMETWQNAEEAGINTMSVWSSKQMLRVFAKYRKERDGKIQWLGHTSFDKDKIKIAIDNGAVGVYVCGDPTDRCVKSGRYFIDKRQWIVRRNSVSCNQSPQGSRGGRDRGRFLYEDSAPRRLLVGPTKRAAKA